MNFIEVIDFWFQEDHKKAWFNQSDSLDEEIRSRFLELHTRAIKAELFVWRNEAKGRLAEIIVLDQFSRNMFRGKAQCFAGDSTALVLAQEAVRIGADREFTPEEKLFLYLPYMHSESSLIHEEALKLFSQKGLEENLKFELLHKNIIDRFGRYPHRNKILGRETSPEEAEFLKGPNSSF